MLNKKNRIFFSIFMLSGWWSLMPSPFSLAQNDAQGNLNTHFSLETSSTDSARVKVKSPTGALIRSVIFPGWGQFYNKKYFKALLVFGTETGLVANSIYLNQKYKASTTDLEREFYINNRNLSNWWLVGVILVSMADAFVDAHLHNFDENPDLLSMNINPMIAVDKFIGIQLSYRF